MLRGLEEIKDMGEIEKRHNEVPYPAISFCKRRRLFANSMALSRISESRVSAFKAKIRGDYYLCFRGTKSLTGYFVFRTETGGGVIPGCSILDGVGLPKSYRAYAKPCVFIPNGFAVKIN